MQPRLDEFESRIVLMTCECFTKPWSAGNDREDERVCNDDCKCRCHAVEADMWYTHRELLAENKKYTDARLKLWNLEQILRYDAGGPVQCRCEVKDFFKVKIDDKDRSICRKCCGVEKF